jgi:DNA-directed RNA polymerase subunit M/transcription elongation factor TFIIS|tara:strand:- start:82 stop:462 length:381 start_codon:yes stop_codon:yes gene_type:complete
MNSQIIHYCKNCSDNILGKWKGWRFRDPIPILPKIVIDECDICGNTEKIFSKDIKWFNYHSQYSSGLPDYWLLLIDDKENQWGFPYYSEEKCKKCGNLSVVSINHNRNGRDEFIINCQNCGASNAN